MSDEAVSADPSVVEVPIATVVGEDPIATLDERNRVLTDAEVLERFFLEPNPNNDFDRSSPHLIIQIRREQEQLERVGRGRERDRDRRSRYESCSPPRDREVSSFLANPVRPDYIVGASIEEWNDVISEYRALGEREGIIYEAHQVVEQLLARFTRLSMDANASANDDEDTANYVEAVFVRRTGTHHLLYTGKNGGKYFYDVNGQVKYIKALKLEAEMVNPDEVAVIDTNPVLKTTDVIVRR